MTECHNSEYEEVVKGRYTKINYKLQRSLLI